jgi:ATP-dependent helicase/nuclease subunit B
MSGQLTEDDRSTIQVWGARGVDEEVKDVLRWVLTANIALDEVEIAYTRPATYLPAMVDVADRFGLEVSFGDGVPVTLTRPGRGLRGLLQWILEGYPVDGFAGLLQAGLFQFERKADEPMASMPNLAALLLEAPIGERIERYATGLDALILDAESNLQETKSERRRARAIESRLGELRRLHRGIRDLESVLPSSDETTLGELAALCLRFLEMNSVIGDEERDTIARESLTDRVGQYADNSTVVKSPFGLQLFVDMVDRHTIQVSTAQPGALYAVDIARAGYTGRKNLFIIGMDVDSFPGRASEDPILLDLERERVSKHLGRRSLEAGDRMWHLSRALGVAPGRVFLGTTAFDPEREDTIVYPSPFIQSAAGQLGYDYNALPGIGAESTLDDVDILLPQRDRADFRLLASRCYPWLVRGQRAVDERKTPVFTRFEGWLGRSEPMFEISPSGPVFSNTRLERLANCGHRYFLADVLKVRRPDYYEMDPARWLPAKDFGLLLHELYHDFLQELNKRGERVDLASHRRLAFDMLSEVIERYKERFPIDNLAAHRYEVQRLEQSVETFLRTESVSTATPVRFELTFGYPDAEITELVEPVTIELGHGVGFLLSGRIDRVDESDDGLVIWDYKTGSSWRFTQGDLLRGGLNLQWTLYAEALERFAAEIGLKGNVSKSGYYFASDRENGLQLAEKPLSEEELLQVIGPLIRMVNQGAFLKVIKDKQACTFCDFNAICSREALTRKEMKDRWEANRGEDFFEPLDNWVKFESRQDLMNL